MTARAKFWRGRGVTTEQVRVAEGAVLVWDEIAGHYTGVHSLSDRAERRILKIAEARMKTEKTTTQMGAQRLRRRVVHGTGEGECARCSRAGIEERIQNAHRWGELRCFSDGGEHVSRHECLDCGLVERTVDHPERRIFGQVGSESANELLLFGWLHCRDLLWKAGAMDAEDLMDSEQAMREYMEVRR